MRAVRLSWSPGCSRTSFSSGNSGVRSSKRGAVARLVGIEPEIVSIRMQRRVLLVAARGTEGALEGVALAKGEVPRLADRDVDVLVGREVALAAQEAVALVAQVEKSPALDKLALVGDVGAGLQVALAAALAALGPRRLRRLRRLPGSLPWFPWLLWWFWFWPCPWP